MEKDKKKTLTISSGLKKKINKNSISKEGKKYYFGEFIYESNTKKLNKNLHAKKKRLIFLKMSKLESFSFKLSKCVLSLMA